MKTVLAKALNSRDSLPLKPSVVRSNQRHAEDPENCGNASVTKNNMTLEEFLASDDSQHDSDCTTDDTAEAASILLSLLQEL